MLNLGCQCRLQTIFVKTQCQVSLNLIVINAVETKKLEGNLLAFYVLQIGA